MSNTPVPPSVDTLSRWTIEAKNNNGWILLGISKLFFLAAVMAFWLMKADASSQVERIFFMTVWIVMLASVAGSLIPQTRRFEKFLENYDSFVVFGQVLLCAIISVKFCDEGLDCTTTISKNNVQSCLACYNLNGPNFGNLNSGLQLRVGKQGLSLLIFLLCEISNSRMLYSTIPLQVLFISLPSLSEGEAAASIISVCGSLLICVVKVVQISHNKLAKPESAKQLPDNMVINMPMSGKKSNLKGITKQPYSRAAGELDRQVFITHQMHQVSGDSASGEQALNAKGEKPVHWDHPGSGPVLVKKTFVKETQKEIYSYQSRPKVSFAPVEVQSRKQSYGVSGNLVDRGRTNLDEETEDHEGDQLSVKA